MLQLPDGAPPGWGEELGAASQRVLEPINERYPDLDAQAIKAIKALFLYGYR